MEVVEGACWRIRPIRHPLATVSTAQNCITFRPIGAGVGRMNMLCELRAAPPHFGPCNPESPVDTSPPPSPLQRCILQARLTWGFRGTWDEIERRLHRPQSRTSSTHITDGSGESRMGQYTRGPEAALIAAGVSPFLVILNPAARVRPILAIPPRSWRSNNVGFTASPRERHQPSQPRQPRHVKLSLQSSSPVAQA